MAMSSRLILLLTQGVFGGLCYASVPSGSAQLAARFAFSPRDYRRINELALEELPRRRHDVEAAVQESRRMPQIQYARRPDSFPLPYLVPPARDSIVIDYGESNFLPHNHRTEPRPARPATRAATRAPTRAPTRASEHQSATSYVRDHAPLHQTDIESESSLESQANAEKKLKDKLPAKALELSTDGDRIEFQIQGHEGPKTYIFGFDTGDGKNRQFRLEERLKDGTVKGHYGYYDARGKLRTIRYLARPFEGYKEKHHEGNNVSSE